MITFCLKCIFKCTDTVLQGAVCLPWYGLYPLWSVTTICDNIASSVKVTAVLFLDRTQGFGLLSTLAGANCSIASEENQDTEVNSNSYFLFFAHTVSHVALSCCDTWCGGSFLFFPPFSRDASQPGGMHFKGNISEVWKTTCSFLTRPPETVVPRSCHLMAVSLLFFRTLPQNSSFYLEMADCALGVGCWSRWLPHCVNVLPQTTYWSQGKIVKSSIQDVVFHHYPRAMFCAKNPYHLVVLFKKQQQTYHRKCSCRTYVQWCKSGFS